MATDPVSLRRGPDRVRGTERPAERRQRGVRPELLGEPVHRGERDGLGVTGVTLSRQPFGILDLGRDLAVEHVRCDHGEAGVDESIGVGDHVVVQAPPGVEDDDAGARTVRDPQVGTAGRVADGKSG